MFAPPLDGAEARYLGLTRKSEEATYKVRKTKGRKTHQSHPWGAALHTALRLVGPTDRLRTSADFAALSKMLGKRALGIIDIF